MMTYPKVLAAGVAVAAVALVAGMYLESVFLRAPFLLTPISSSQLPQSGTVVARNGTTLQIQGPDGVETITLSPQAQIAQEAVAPKTLNDLTAGAYVIVETPPSGAQTVLILPGPETPH